jgi:hypothetical protein
MSPDARVGRAAPDPSVDLQIDADLRALAADEPGDTALRCTRLRSWGERAIERYERSFVTPRAGDAAIVGDRLERPLRLLAGLGDVARLASGAADACANAVRLEERRAGRSA